MGGLAVNELPLALQVLLTLAIVVPMGPMMYRLMYQPIASAPVLICLIVSVAVHIAMVGLGCCSSVPKASVRRRSANSASSSAR